MRLRYEGEFFRLAKYGGLKAEKGLLGISFLLGFCGRCSRSLRSHGAKKPPDGPAAGAFGKAAVYMTGAMLTCSMTPSVVLETKASRSDSLDSGMT